MAEEELNSVAPAPAQAPEAAEKKPVRRRVARKAADPADAPEAAATPDAEAKPVRKRATRKKTEESEASAEAAAESKPVRRGRPRKVDAAAAEAAAPVAGAALAAEAAAPAAGESTPEAEAAKPARRRGRPRKVDSAEGEAAAVNPPVEKVEKPAEQPADKPAEKPVEKQADKPAEKPVENQADKPAAKSEGKQGEKAQQGEQRQGRDRRRQRRDKHQRNNDNRNRNQVVEPKTNKEELAALKVAELREKAAELEIDAKGMLKADLVDAVFAELVKREGFRDVKGILDILPDGYGFVRTKGYLPSEGDAYVNQSMIRRNHLRKGDWIEGQMRAARANEKFGAIQRLDTVNGHSPESLGNRVKFADLTPVFPDERLTMEHGKNYVTARVIDLTAPIGKGQRGLIVSPPKAGKTTVLKDIAAAIAANNPEVHLMCLLVDERPEEVTDMQRSIKGEVIASTFDMPSENHIAVAELVIERAKRMVEDGEDVVILLDSITRLARAYNLAQPASGRVLSGGVDSTALYPPKRFLGAARNIEHGGSLTILASALIDTGSKMDEVIFEEFKGTGNMELKLDRSLADRRIFPAIDPVTSGTRKEDLLMNPQEAPLIWAVRRILANLNNTERAMNMLIKSLRQTDTNTEFLLRTAKKMQGRAASDIVEF